MRRHTFLGAACGAGLLLAPIFGAVVVAGVTRPSIPAPATVTATAVVAAEAPPVPLPGSAASGTTFPLVADGSSTPTTVSAAGPRQVVSPSDRAGRPSAAQRRTAQSAQARQRAS